MNKKPEDYPGYEGKGILDHSLYRYNGLCLEGNEKHPPFPFELWLYCGHIIKNKEDLENSLISNNGEGTRRREAKI